MQPRVEDLRIILTQQLLVMQIDGIELMSELLQNESWSHIPIIGERALSLQAGFTWTGAVLRH